MKVLLEKMKGKNIPQLVAEGRGKFASMPSGGGAPSASAPVAAAKKEEPKKVEAPKEEEVDLDMGGMFGDY